MMIEALPTSTNKIRTLAFLAICGLAAIGAAVTGIDDHPPGILLAYMAATAFVLAFVHPWRSARRFFSLLIASLLGVALFVLLNNVFAAIAHAPGTTGVLQVLLQALAVAAFVLATLVLPAAILVGAAGSLAMFMRSRWSTPGPTALPGE
jgi:hypothetical protein